MIDNAVSPCLFCRSIAPEMTVPLRGLLWALEQSLIFQQLESSKLSLFRNSDRHSIPHMEGNLHPALTMCTPCGGFEQALAKCLSLEPLNLLHQRGFLSGACW